MKAKNSLKVAAIGAATATLMTFGLGPASAHISVTPDATMEGGYTQLNFRVPSESKTASTTKIKVDLPTATPFTSVRVKPVPGWTAEIVRGKLPQSVIVDGSTITEAPLSVTWTANDALSQLSADQYQTFSLSVGSLPKSGTTILLPAAQTYSDGSVRNWDDPAVQSQGEPQDPAPSFMTTAAGSGGDGHAGHAATAAAEAAVVPAAAVSSEPPVPALTWVALAAGLLGLVAGVVAFLRAGRTGKS